MNHGDDHGYRTGGSDPDDPYGGTGQTRTRLPGSGDDGYGAARRPVRTSRSLITVVGVVVLLIAAIAFANRGGDDGGGGGEGDGAKGREAAPTAPTGVKPVKGKAAGTGIPTGYAKDAQGAQSAAANYAVALGSDGMFQEKSRGDIVRTVHDPAVAEELLTKLAKAYSTEFLGAVGLGPDGTAPDGLAFVSRTIPIGTKVTDQKDGTATVEVWCTGLIGLAGPESTKPVTSSYFTLTQNLKWVDGDWKITSSSQQEGPTPVNGDNRASTAEEIASAVAGYGGFTHAR
ncbi:hypothetical protein ACH4E8_05905 [Streptomyces sp. NPDC017979]|uniref:hypothetical protein n=1 Tax=Streptomyces sp. NPDC017979 TaxID=3365024 RepID=UPI003791F920